MIGKTSGTSTVYLIQYSVSVCIRLKRALCLHIPGKVSDSCWVMSEVLLLRGRGLSLPPSSSSPPHSDSWHSSTSDSWEDKDMVRQRCKTDQISWKHTGMWLADTVQTKISRIWNMVRKNRACKHATVIRTLVKDSTRHRGNLEKCISQIIQQHGLNKKFRVRYERLWLNMNGKGRAKVTQHANTCSSHNTLPESLWEQAELPEEIPGKKELTVWSSIGTLLVVGKASYRWTQLLMDWLRLASIRERERRGKRRETARREKR